jgi:hypothetical protein
MNNIELYDYKIYRLDKAENYPLRGTNTIPCTKHDFICTIGTEKMYCTKCRAQLINGKVYNG